MEITLFCAKPRGQIFQCHVKDVKMLRFLVHCIKTLLAFDYPKFQEFLFSTFQSRNVGVKSDGTKADV